MSDQDHTRDFDETSAETLLGSGPRAPTSASHPSFDGARFAPGEILAARYRIVGLLGRGGMGEVYRADDLKLGEPVALKFLPESLARDGAALARFHNEIRTARRITHKNVVRVHDLGEIAGEPFLAMEYVDGEDLSVLLRRIGRLPQDKAVELSRQICAGLAAAHDQGVLHRDLKPANVMVDGKGQAKINDFGLAGLAEELERGDFAGTPRYMAPEQLAAGEVSTATDIYALGLVLYEMFSGKPPFEAKSRAELEALQRDSDPSRLSEHVSGLDPLIENAVSSCLARAPSARPRSALEVAARLPGGDPLAAALAAGETPSPEMVAGARVHDAIRPWLSATLLGAFLVTIAATVYLNDRLGTTGMLHLPRAPVLLEDDFLSFADELGLDLSSHAIYWGFDKDFAQFEYMREQLSPAEAREMLATNQPPPFRFWLAASQSSLPSTVLFPRLEDFERLEPGAVRATLAPDGRLIELAAPPASNPIAGRPPTPWERLFEAAGLDISDFEEATPLRLPEGYADERRAWVGRYPGLPDLETRVEAASLAGRPTSFRIFLPWHDLEAEAGGQMGTFGAIFAVLIVVIPTVLGLALIVAYRNLRSGRGDRRGATRLAAFLLIVLTAGGVLGGEWTGSISSRMGALFHELASNLLVAALFWVVYVALEPAVRKRWPAGLVSWTRLVAGEFRDPLIGRDILVGGLLGVTQVLAARLLELGTRPSLQDAFWHEAYEGFGGAMTTLLQTQTIVPLLNAFQRIFILALSLALVRRRSVAVVLVGVFSFFEFIAVMGMTGSLQLSYAAFSAVLIAVCTGYVGLLAITSYFYLFFLLLVNPGPSFELGSWSSGMTVGYWLIALGIAFYGYWTMSGTGRRTRSPARPGT